jgi:SPRY domain
LVIESIVDRESFFKQCLQLDSATRDYLTTRLDYYQVNIDISKRYRADSSLTVTSSFTNVTASKICYTSGHSNLIWDVSIHKCTMTVNASINMNIRIGFAPSKLFGDSKRNLSPCGWYLSLYDGTLYSQDGYHGDAYCSRCKEGNAITCIYNASTSEISFEKSGVSLGVAYTNVNGDDIAPAVQLYYPGDNVTLSID